MKKNILSLLCVMVALSTALQAQTHTIVKRTTAVGEFVSLHIYDTAGTSWDRLYMDFLSTASDSFDADDALKLPGSDFNFFSYSADGDMLSIDARPYAAGKTIQLGINTTVLQPYIIEIDEDKLPDSETLYLRDNYLDTTVLLTLGTEYPFTIDTETASQGNRFQLLTSLDTSGTDTSGTDTSGTDTSGTDTGLIVTNLRAAMLQINVLPNPTTSTVFIQYTTHSDANKSMIITNAIGQRVYSLTLGNAQTGSVSADLSNMPSGLYLVRFISGDDAVTKRILKE